MVAPFKSMASDAATFTGDLVDMIKRFSEGTTSFALVGAGPLNRPYTKNPRIFGALYRLRNRHFSRPQFDALCHDATKRQFDVIMAWSVDRLGRSLQDLVGFLSEIHALKIDLYLHQQGLDTTTPAGKAMFQMMGVFAEFERAMIQERVRAGLARARAEGVRLGRPNISDETERAIRHALKQKNRPGLIKIAKALGVGVGTVQHVAAEL
jgi:DNA invertase Pin-like site-specific DNA recombinase